MPAAEHLVSLPDRYRVTRRIASGGMATVYATEDTLLGRLVAVKVVAPAFAADDDAKLRFQREARAAARVSDHPHVVTIYDIGEYEDQAFIVMEYFAGGTVADRLRSGTPIPRATALGWIDEAASALDHAHAAGIVHRDVKPANLLLDANGRLAVGDFGIARMASDSGVTMTGQVLGTAAYLSPEQAVGEPATPASDRYALAVVAFQLLTGRRPFEAEHAAAQARAHVETPPPAATDIAPDLPAAVNRVLWRGLDKEPDRRWGKAAQMAQALEDAVGSDPVAVTAATTPMVPRGRRPERTPTPAPPPLPRSRPRLAEPVPPPKRTNRRLAPLLALVLAAAVVGAAFAILTGGSGSDGSGGSASTSSQRASRTRHTPASAKTAKSKPAAAAKTTPAAAAPTQSTPTQAAPPPAPGLTAQRRLQAQGHALIDQGNYAQAVAVLSQAVHNCPVQTTDPCAYALYDLGHALRLAGRPAEAIPVLQQRLQNPFAADVVRAELQRAEADAAQQQSGASTPPAPSGKPSGKGPKPGKGHGHGHG